MGGACCADSESRELADNMLQEILDKTEDPLLESNFIIKDDFVVKSESPAKKLSVSEK